MTDRIKFNFTRTVTVLQTGICSVDVLNPADHNEIKEKLEQRKFASFVVMDEEFLNQPVYQYMPIIENPSA